jgi:hypothetical protein
LLRGREIHREEVRRLFSPCCSARPGGAEGIPFPPSAPPPFSMYPDVGLAAEKIRFSAGGEREVREGVREAEVLGGWV